jgi:hypothetical protein
MDRKDTTFNKIFRIFTHKLPETLLIAIGLPFRYL